MPFPFTKYQPKLASQQGTDFTLCKFGWLFDSQTKHTRVQQDGWRNDIAKELHACIINFSYSN